jgi:SNF2 family DNA or RNA helicase
MTKSLRATQAGSAAQASRSFPACTTASSIGSVQTEPLWKHQQYSVDFFDTIGFDTSDPGTGKTRVQVELYRRRSRPRGRWLILCPKTLMYSAWAKELREVAPELSYSLAYAKDREAAFNSGAEVVILNHDGIKWLLANPTYLRGFDHLTIDEITAFKHPTSQRSKAIKKLSKQFKFRYGLTGTPNPNSVTELWHQIYILDGGKRLGPTFYGFRQGAQVAEQVGPMPNHLRWVDKPGAAEAVSQLISDITVRHVFEDVMTHVPPNHRARYPFILNSKLRKLYNQLERDAVMMLESGRVIPAVAASTLRQKLLQVASGAVYRIPENSDESTYELLDGQRYELVADIVDEYDHSLVFFNWKHQREQLVKEFAARGKRFAVMDGSTPQARRNEIVDAFQSHQLDTVLLHPRTGAHGITMTTGRACIFASPIYEADLAKQAMFRIYRGAQDKVTNTIMVEAEDTVEQYVYERLFTKEQNMMDFLDILRSR